MNYSFVQESKGRKKFSLFPSFLYICIYERAWENPRKDQEEASPDGPDKRVSRKYASDKFEKQLYLT